VEGRAVLCLSLSPSDICLEADQATLGFSTIGSLEWGRFNSKLWTIKYILHDM